MVENVKARLIQARIDEMAAREIILQELRLLKLGVRETRLICEKELDYPYLEMRTILFSLGLILTSDAMTSTDPVIRLKIEKLKNWRYQRSKSDDVPAFRIISNRTLMAVAESNVDGKEGLKEIEGLGPKKIDSFGDDILNLLRTARVAPRHSLSSVN